MHDEEAKPVHKLSDTVEIKRWRTMGTVVARSFSPLCYDIQCGKKLHRKVPARWVTPVTGETGNIIQLVA